MRLKFVSLFSILTVLTLGAQQPQPSPSPKPTTPPAAKIDKQPNTKEKVNSNDTTAPTPDELLTSPDAREVAVYKCAYLQEKSARADKEQFNVDGCPINDIADVIAKNAQRPLMDGQGKDTALAIALKKLVNQQFNGESVFDKKVDYAVIHLVDWQGAMGQARQARAQTGAAKGKDGKGSAGAAPKAVNPQASEPASTSENGDVKNDVPDSKAHAPRERWILVSRTAKIPGLPKAITLSEKQRVLGSKSVAVIFVHVNTPLDPGLDPLLAYGDVTYRAIVKQKLPINIQHLLAILQVAGKLQAAEQQNFVALLGFGLLTQIPVPSDITVFGVEPPNAANNTNNAYSLIGQARKFDNEGKYFWDASLGVPVNKLSLLEFEDENQTFVPKTINKQSVYALINVYPIPVDLKEGNVRWWLPRFVGGPGLTGRPGENFMIGGALGLPQFQFFFGSGFANHRVLRPGADPTKGTSFDQKYSSRLTYGINVPVFSALKKLSSGSNNSSDSSKSNKPAATTGGK